MGGEAVVGVWGGLVLSVSSVSMRHRRGSEHCMRKWSELMMREEVILVLSAW